MIENSLFESFAHYARGLATMSFFMWVVVIYNIRRRNRMTFLLFLFVCYVELGYLKDFIFLFPSFYEKPLIEDLVSIFDISCTPLVCAFFLEATYPGIVRNRSLLISYLLFIAFMPLYSLTPSSGILLSVFVLSVLSVLCTLVVVSINAVRYDKLLSENYSYKKNISVKWVVICISCYFLWLLGYEFLFYEPTWLGEAVYDGGSAIFWNIVCVLNYNHQVVVDPFTLQSGVGQSGVGQSDDNPSDVGEDYREVSAKDVHLANALQHCMEIEKLYLNPRLSLNDLVVAVGSNKTYLSTHINRQGKTFYDYINEYRVVEACRIMDVKSMGERLSMADVASRSGFNSISSFNRYFFKIKGITPSQYSRRMNHE